ncbi:hypothetical protein FEP84_05680 [Burkholderia multivorans]|nr:hypothetical protein [Burkholderia multivorans]
MHDFEVLLLVPAADVVRFARHAAREYFADRAAVVAYIQPVTHVLAVAVHGQRLAGECVRDHQRNEFFRELVRAVVVRAVRRQRRQAVGVMVCANEMIGAGLGCRVGAVRRVRRRLGELRVRGGQRAEHFVGRDVQEAEGGLVRVVQAVPVLAGSFQQREGADHIGLHEIGRPVNRAIDMAFRREVQHRARLVLGKERVERSAVADIDTRKHVLRIAFQRLQRTKVARVGQFVDVEHGFVGCAQPVEYKVGADKACASCHQYHVVPFTLSGREPCALHGRQGPFKAARRISRNRGAERASGPAGSTVGCGRPSGAPSRVKRSSLSYRHPSPTYAEAQTPYAEPPRRARRSPCSPALAPTHRADRRAVPTRP